jgi:peptidoglycan/LPS O-acetylase OafA/YrhL
MVFVGVLSYSLYLWQQPFLNRHLGTSWMAAFPVNIILAGVMALASYYLVEQPFLRLRARRSQPTGARPVLITASPKI